MADDRKLEKTSVPGVFRRHAAGCRRNGRRKYPAAEDVLVAFAIPRGEWKLIPEGA